MLLANLLKRVFPERIATRRRPRWDGLFAPGDAADSRTRARACRPQRRLLLAVVVLGGQFAAGPGNADALGARAASPPAVDGRGRLARPARVGVVLFNTLPQRPGPFPTTSASPFPLTLRCRPAMSMFIPPARRAPATAAMRLSCPSKRKRRPFARNRRRRGPCTPCSSNRCRSGNGPSTSSAR